MLTLGFKLILLLGEEKASLDLETVVPSLKVSIFWSSLLLKVVVEEGNRPDRGPWSSRPGVSY